MKTNTSTLPAVEQFEGSATDLRPLHCEPDQEGHCITCADEALPARVLQVDPARLLAQVDIAGTRTEVDISLVDGVVAGRWLLVHGGVALEQLDEAG